MSATSGYACATARSRSFSLGRVTLRALEWGDPGQPALCLLHGGSAHAHWFDEIVPAFTDRYHVLALDQRGHGTSDWATGAAYSIEDFAADLIGVMDRMGWARMTLVGHSMGGHVAMGFAAWHTERLERLVILDSRVAVPGHRRRRIPGLLNGSPTLHPTMESAVGSFRLFPRETVADPRLLEHLARTGIIRREDRFVYRFDPTHREKRRLADGWDLLDRIRIPTLLVRGELSPILPRTTAAAMVERLPRARLAEIPGAYHHLMLDAPLALIEVLGAFLCET